jgi:hypothetical protein
VKDVLTYAPVPLIAGWVAALLPRDVLASLAFADWHGGARDVAVGLGTVLVPCALGYCWIKSYSTVRRRATCFTAGFLVGTVGCAILEFVVKEVLDRKATTIIVRDYVWKYVYVLTLISMVLAVVFWTYYMMIRLRPKPE